MKDACKSIQYQKYLTQRLSQVILVRHLEKWAGSIGGKTDSKEITSNANKIRRLPAKQGSKEISEKQGSLLSGHH